MLLGAFLLVSSFYFYYYGDPCKDFVFYSIGTFGVWDYERESLNVALFDPYKIFCFSFYPSFRVIALDFRIYWKA
jgi:hypothetical protein